MDGLNFFDQIETRVNEGDECRNDFGIDWALLRERADDAPFDEKLSVEFFASCLPWLDEETSNDSLTSSTLLLDEVVAFSASSRSCGEDGVGGVTANLCHNVASPFSTSFQLAISQVPPASAIYATTDIAHLAGSKPGNYTSSNASSSLVSWGPPIQYQQQVHLPANFQTTPAGSVTHQHLLYQIYEAQDSRNPPSADDFLSAAQQIRDDASSLMLPSEQLRSSSTISIVSCSPNIITLNEQAAGQQVLNQMVMDTALKGDRLTESCRPSHHSSPDVSSSQGSESLLSRNPVSSRQNLYADNGTHCSTTATLWNAEQGDDVGPNHSACKAAGSFVFNATYDVAYSPEVGRCQPVSINGGSTSLQPLSSQQQPTARPYVALSPRPFQHTSSSTTTFSAAEGLQSRSNLFGQAGANPTTNNKRTGSMMVPSTSNRSSTISKTVSGRCEKDTTRKKAAEIARLEDELQAKLSIAQALLLDNQELHRKERQLSLQVANGDSIKVLAWKSVGGGVSPQLLTLLQEFRQNINQIVKAGDTCFSYSDITGGVVTTDALYLSTTFTVKDFMKCWRSFVEKISSLLMEDLTCPTVLASAEGLLDLISKWCIAVNIHKSTVVIRALTLNMSTEETLIQHAEFWSQLVEKLRLSNQQVSDFLAVWSLYSEILQGQSQEEVHIMNGISKLIDSFDYCNISASGHHNFKDKRDISKADHPESAASCVLQALEEQDKLIRSFFVVHKRCNMLHTMLSYLVFGLLSPWQRCYTIRTSYPSFPNLKMILAAVCGKVQPLSSMPST
ncbi:hypothetical protein CEUSTIGMA_g12903.t1 [Chlamydomonas eustigma]|uniref:Uncharacterized protein n=1 Tax=Chlamydomonas eustigma TaxID=1157962 RepID=A0A250XQZ3_9CHLO|nr:hypothetical protein CEUSTIGMA_g12903.t1 [Chlamydomonas eustigma]|eukprot:GAX85487.1 hypothetical protein CEUSTIGMA_g12903.t1 [Chlamydomonas eustigma]